jgi:glutathione peroxidase
MFEKISVTGTNRHPLYAWLEKETGKVPNWNFCKYLIDEQGNVKAFFPSSVNPMDEVITGDL